MGMRGGGLRQDGGGAWHPSFGPVTADERRRADAFYDELFGRRARPSPGELDELFAEEAAGPGPGAAPGGAAAQQPAGSLPHMAFQHILLERLDPTVGGMVPGVVPADPSALTTPFFDARTAGVTPDASLQGRLTALIHGKSVYKQAGKNLAVGLVDLSGAGKLAPRYAGHNDLDNMYAASVTKLVGVLGAYQLLAEANQLLVAKPATPDLQTLANELAAGWTSQGIAAPHHPLVAEVLDFHPGSPPTASLRPELTARFDQLSKGNQNGSTAIVLLKFPYIGSTLLAHGLYSPANRGGLWVSKAYGAITYRGKPFSLPTWPASQNPHPGHPVHNMNAVCAAQFYTLAAQRRMIDGASSRAILTHLHRDGCFVSIDRADVNNLTASGELAMKCGAFGGFVHETLHFKETATLREFVAVIMTQNSSSGLIKPLFKDLVAMVP
jgi:hypothetical protein